MSPEAQNCLLLRTTALDLWTLSEIVLTDVSAHKPLRKSSLYLTYFLIVNVVNHLLQWSQNVCLLCQKYTGHLAGSQILLSGEFLGCPVKATKKRSLKYILHWGKTLQACSLVNIVVLFRLETYFNCKSCWSGKLSI